MHGCIELYFRIARYNIKNWEKNNQYKTSIKVPSLLFNLFLMTRNDSIQTKFVLFVNVFNRYIMVAIYAVTHAI